ncbi:F0F1 ATP synthase subunit delta [Ferrimonas balearica]|uniref:F0F1 ATP synthase subunit delta n=1 Tax=Ferrimonas balearica TaxID=44012 RepID=UPI001C5786A5|nr:F0F1 ATP synthase subunit delta [Ferrimonas balearica]MBY6019902.1 F0F1 ATP synthase subunit delta [Halomonas denitrificans]MBW3141719.1 F0F1 ATP synthase subunit delta [Ferrimonas balearica]MBW3166673.1 F0F1 ATP synthase subunit delta [Ferrimonas balearica]MBY5982451.1 F0F1 ATP synthase subunit delta [Ferrimonas balearica]MBY6097009.1 F0F1 ATP synthase subunit delta [Ferrimonas balearica]
MSELTTVARPYAKAAFEFAVEKQAVDQWAQMLAFLAEVTVNETVADLLSGQVNAEQLAQIFIQIGGEQIDEHGQNLIKVMAENGRLVALPAVAQQFIELREEWQKEITAEVQSAVELSDEQQANIAASLEQRLARKVKLNCSVNPELIAGVVITAGDLVIDGSVRGKLSRLSDTLQS